MHVTRRHRPPLGSNVPKWWLYAARADLAIPPLNATRWLLQDGRGPVSLVLHGAKKLMGVDDRTDLVRERRTAELTVMSVECKNSKT